MSNTGDAWVWFASAALYLALLVVLARTLDFAPLELDDAGTLSELSGAAFGEVLGYDRFGHMRPAKSALFWLLARSPDSLEWVRALVVGAFALSTLGIQWLASSLLGSRGWGLAAAACFALNPTVMSTAAWLSTANYVFCLLFMLAFLLAATRALGLAGAAASEHGRRFAGCTIASVSLVVATLHHELALLSPLLLFVYPARRGFRRGDRAVIVSLAGGWLVAASLQGVLRLIGDRPDIAYRMAEHPAWALLLSSARYFWTDLGLWAYRKALFGVLWVDDPTTNLGWSTAAWPALLLLAAGAVRLWRADAISRFAMAWALLFLLPVTNLIPLGVTACATHYLFLPGAGLACLLARIAQRMDASLRRRRPSHRVALAAPAASIMVLVGVWLSDGPRAVALWGDEIGLFRAAIQNHPENIEVRVNLASQYIKHQRLREAEALLDQSLELAPHDPMLLRNRVLVFRSLGPPDRALAFLEAHSDDPVLRTDEYRFARAELLELLDRRDEALAMFGALAQDSADPNVRVLAAARQAKIHADGGRAREGQRVIERMLREFPGNQQLLLMLDLLVRQQRPDGASNGPQ